jgi:DNA-binding NarL/FixJ family response regulator
MGWAPVTPSDDAHCVLPVPATPSATCHHVHSTSAQEVIAVVRVMVTEDNDLIRDAVVGILTAAGDITVVAQCTDGDEVLEEARRTDPDVIVMDLSMKRMSGLEATRVLLSDRPDARVVILTGSLSAGNVREAHGLGARGFLLKDGDPEELVAAVRTVAAGGTAWSAPALAHLEAV